MKQHFLAQLFIALAVFLLGWPSVSYSQTLDFPYESGGSPNFWLDIGYFFQDKDTLRTEIYYSIALKELDFHHQIHDSLASFHLAISIKDQNGKTIFSETRQKKVRAASASAMADETAGVVDQFTMSMPAGLYQLEARLTDENANRSTIISGQINAPSLTNTVLSEPQLAITINAKLTNPAFKKGSTSVMPNPSRRYRCHDAILSFYYEIAHLTTPTAISPAPLWISHIITDHTGDTLMVMPKQRVAFAGTTCARALSIDVRALEKGEHTLHIVVLDSLSGQTAMAKKRFWIHEPTVQVQVLPMSGEDIKRYRDQIKYIASRDELRLFDELNNEGKTNFLLNFWRAKDETPATPQNEYMQNLFSRIDYANKHFKGKENGLNSDMGRVFVVYGKPDDIENYNWEGGAKSYKIWQYFTAGGQHSFIFVDRNHEGIFYLVHSTVEGEIKNENWKTQEVNTN